MFNFQKWVSEKTIRLLVLTLQSLSSPMSRANDGNKLIIHVLAIIYLVSITVVKKAQIVR